MTSEEIAALIRCAQAYDYENRPPREGWRRVSDTQVLRLLIGAGVIKA